MKEPRLFYRSSRAATPPAPDLTVTCPFWVRWSISRELDAYFHGNMRFADFFLFRAGLVATPIVFAFLAFYIPSLVQSNLLGGDAYTDGQRIAASLLAAALTFLVAKLAFAFRLSGVETPHYEFDAHHAAEISKSAGKILEQELPANVIGAIKMLKMNATEPYLVVRGIAPVRTDFPLKPEKRRQKAIKEAKASAIKRWTRNIDATAGGLLHLLETEPAPRFADDAADEELVVDKFTQLDVQELPDMRQSDVFLRFHQSTIERPFRRICRYKTYTALSNFRKKPIYLLRVRDIIDCLENRDQRYSEEDHKEIFWSSPNLDKTNVVQVLMDDKFVRQPPRAIRFLKGDDKEVGRRIIRKENGDYIMAFDPARVWIHSSGSTIHAEAILALRWAIHLVSRDQLRIIKLNSRDVLIVDNRRAMVARREDEPGIGWRDIFVTLIARLPNGPDFSGWWLRVVFGYPHENYAGKAFPNQRSHGAGAIDEHREASN